MSFIFSENRTTCVKPSVTFFDDLGLEFLEFVNPENIVFPPFGVLYDTISDNVVFPVPGPGIHYVGVVTGDVLNRYIVFL